MDLVDKKLSWSFNWWDQDRDGYITQDDMDKMLSQLLALADENDTENKEALNAGFMEWRRLLLENLEDRTSEKINQQDFIRIMRTVILPVPENFDNTSGKLVVAVLGAADRDKNGTISLDEYTNLYVKLGIPREFAPEAFRRLDRDGSGELSHDEVTEANRELYLSTDPNAPGNWLLGPMNI